MSTMAGTLLPPAGIATNAGSPPAQRMVLVTISGKGWAIPGTASDFLPHLLHWGHLLILSLLRLPDLCAGNTYFCSALLQCMSLQLADIVAKVQNCPVIIFTP